MDATEQVRFEQTACALCGGKERGRVAKGWDFEYETCREKMTFVECLDCGHVYLNPRPVIECAGMIYPRNYYTMAEGSPRGALRILQGLKDRLLVKRVWSLVKPLPAGSRVLEIGCGDGQLLVALKKYRPDLTLTGLDLQVADYHHRRMEANGIGVLETPLESAQVAEQYDLVIMNQIIEHFWDLSGCLRKIAELTRPGGVLSVATPNLDGYDRRFFRRKYWGGYYYPRHLNLFSRESLGRCLDQFGFDVLQHKNLVAPLIWKGSLLGWLKGKGIFLHRFVKDSSLPLLALFTCLDLVARTLGLSTSNQQVIARRSARQLAAA